MKGRRNGRRMKAMKNNVLGKEIKEESGRERENGGRRGWF